MQPLTNSDTLHMTQKLLKMSLKEYREFKDHNNALLLHSFVCYNDENYNNLSKIIIDRNFDLNHQDKLGYTALHAAISNQNEPVIKMLLDANVNVNTVNINSYTPLMSAVQFQLPDIVKLLIDKGVDTTVKNKNGNIALELIFHDNINEKSLKCSELLFHNSGLKPLNKLESGWTQMGMD